MAQTGFTPISLYYSATAAAVPLAANLTAGELALNTADGKLYYKNSSNVVTLLAGATAGPAGGSNTQVQYNSSGALAGSANLTFNGTTLTAAGLAGPFNGTVGATTASTGAFTTLSASSTVSGTGFSTYLASPPAIGGTAAAAGSFTNLSYTGTLTGGTGVINIGSGQFYKDASGNIGLGNTPSGTYKLEVTGKSYSSGGIVTRTVSYADATSLTFNADTTDTATQANTQATGTLTINAPTGTPYNGQKLIFRLQSTNVQTFAWNAAFSASLDLTLPTASTGSSKYDYMGFQYNSTSAKWNLLARVFGF